MEGEALMRNRQNRRIPKIIALLAAGLVLAAVTAATRAPASSNRAAAVVSKDLCAKAGSVSLPGAGSVPIWGFGLPLIPGVPLIPADCSTATASLPGPVLDVNVNDDVTVNLTIDASLTGRDISFELPGLQVDTNCTPAVGADACFHFTASRPGTFLYQSPGDAGRQEAMGLYGALIVRPTIAGRAYNDLSTAYDTEATLVLSAIDPVFNASPDTFDMNDYLATYWLINGKAYSSTPAESTDPILALAGQRLLLRYVNAGFDNTTMMVLGMHERVIARDAYALNNPFDADAETIPAGATEDTIATVPAPSSGLPNGFPLYNRQLHVTNGSSDDSSYSTPGGMMTFIQP
jgi:FtsP/CotA-like multicopper oxidase with cupredoxin domain